MRPKTKTSESQRLTLKTYTRLMRAADAVTARMHGHLKEHGLTISQFGVLEALYHLGPLCQRDIGRKILKTSGNMTTVIDNLERRKFVLREKDPDDRRFFTVTLTREGFDMIDAIFPGHAEIAREVFSVLNRSEMATLGNLLKKLGKPDSGTC